MCGICGYVGIHDDDLLERMTTSLTHRGPDGEGLFRHGDVGLGHRRLSIIDVAGGQQPIENEDGSLVLVCNGEIYNFGDLREQLLSRGHRFRTKSDSEVVLHLYEEQGPDCLRQLNGMYSIAIWDQPRRQLFLARDRFGIKPMYYARHGDALLFASEMKAILRYAKLPLSINPNAVHEYLALRYVPGPGSLLDGILKLPAAHYGLFRNGKLTLTRYWNPELCHGPYHQSDEEYLEGFSEQFERSIRRRLMSEVPLGAYLSGGIDSGAIVASMSSLVSHPVRTFSVGFDFEHDEVRQAAETARILGCRHSEISCQISDIEMLPRIVHHLDEPIGDAIVIPMFQLSREAKKHVSVILSGEGADETLGGYLFHKALLRGHQYARLIPSWFRGRVMSPALSATPSRLINLAFDYPADLGTRGKLKVVDFIELLDEQHLPEAYRHSISLFDERDTRHLYSPEFRAGIQHRSRSEVELAAVSSKAPYLNRILHLQFEHWLPDDILMKQDKMSMAHAIEARVPFLDHELVEYALRIPPAMKIRGRQTKYVLREYLRRSFPKLEASRKKAPFYVPLERYARHPQFQELVDDTLSPSAVRERGMLCPHGVAAIREATQRGEFMLVKQALSLVMLELWFRMAVDRRGTE